MKKRTKSKEKLKNYQKILIITILFVMIFLASFLSLKFTGFLVKDYPKQVQFYFYDGITNCSLDGYIFIGNKPIGKTTNGLFNLSLENYKLNLENISSNISLFGKLGKCFDKTNNNNLYFDKTWKNIKIKDYNFKGESNFDFKTKINLKSPFRRELIGFITPEITLPVPGINLANKNTLEELSKLNNYLSNKINYTPDNFSYEKSSWQMPFETLEKNKGDCEDFSTTLLSLFLAYNDSLNCYNIVFSNHVSTFCYVENNYIYYDQEKTEIKQKISEKETEGEVKSRLEELKKGYFKTTKINDSETNVYFAFNNKEFIEFNNNDEFINWQYNLKNKKIIQDIFQDTEQQILVNNQEVQQLDLGDLEGELRTQTISLPLLISKKYIYILVPILIILIIIILIFIKKYYF